MSSKLYIFYCGGKAAGCRIEAHDVIIDAGSEPKTCYEQIKRKWFGESTKLHIDGYVEVPGADGYRVELVPKGTHAQTQSDKTLYFIHLGGSVPGQLYEYHELEDGSVVLIPDETYAGYQPEVHNVYWFVK